jgi:hypothetical protein
VKLRVKNRFPEARLGGLFVTSICKKDGYNSFPLFSGLFYLGELIASGKAFKGGMEQRETCMIYVKVVLTLSETIKGIVLTNKNKKLR